MATSLNYEILANNEEFKKRVGVLLLDVAYDVKAESDSTEFHEEREAYTNKLIANVDIYIENTSNNLSVQNGIFQNMHVVTAETLTADQVVDPSVVVGDLMYDGTKTPSAWWDGMDQTIKEQIELIYNSLAGINIIV